MSIFLFSKYILRCPICFKCGEKLIPENEYKGKPVYGADGSQFNCPYCNSSNVTKISTIDRVV